MNIQHLAKLAQVLDNLKEERKVIDHGIERFDMNSWKCGTTACAVGHAMYHPYFNDHGLYPDETWQDVEQTFDEVGYRVTKERLVSAVPTYQGAEEFPACALFFDISEQDANYLFSPSEYYGEEYQDKITPKQVSRRIKEFIINDGRNAPPFEYEEDD